jgi:hypothetical protein
VQHAQDLNRLSQKKLLLLVAKRETYTPWIILLGALGGRLAQMQRLEAQYMLIQISMESLKHYYLVILLEALTQSTHIRAN